MPSFTVVPQGRSRFSPNGLHHAPSEALHLLGLSHVVGRVEAAPVGVEAWCLPRSAAYATCSSKKSETVRPFKRTPRIRIILATHSSMVRSTEPWYLERRTFFLGQQLPEHVLNVILIEVLGGRVPVSIIDRASTAGHCE